MSDEKTKKEHLVNFIKAFRAVEEEMEPYKEHRRDLKKNYVDNGYLSKDELRFAIKAYRMLESGENYEQFTEVYDKVSKCFRRD
tara:strand:- start:209 stop:460 length:252 start_codon:yes stop_codon:yes gene_type:complete